jgi:hypothetical protein
MTLPAQLKTARMTDDTVGNLIDNKISELELALCDILAISPDVDVDAPVVVYPVGCVVDWLTETPPAGWFECDGSAKSRTTYASLYAVIGTMYGVGDGSTTFNLPDFRGKFRRGWDHAAAVDPDRATRTDRGDGVVGDHVGTKQADGLGEHYHLQNYADIPYAAGGNTGYGLGGTPSGGLFTQNSGGNETRPINVNVMAIIRH